ncbi:MAG: SUMF1/EgtB/PvdO family nonheme iron enzyme [Nanoarchaeota archaeon]|nr:SUMF1/EgtB/PvdO family nonheme iron enzyme [Nanoarchaeota archaeon]
MKKIILILFAIVLASTFASAGSCPANWVLVPGSATYSTSDFCVMKYEAKNVGGNATSQADGTPWASITQTNAIAECASLGAGYHLITNAEWMTIARNIEQQTANWADGVIGSTVGSGGLYRGNVGNLDSVGYDGDDPESGTGRDTKAELALSNGGTIWDLSGNVWEWTDDTIVCAGASCTTEEMPYDSNPDSEWIEFTAINTYGLLSYDEIRPSNSNWNADYGVGRLYTDDNAANPTGNVHAFLRGGGSDAGANAGAFALLLSDAPSASDRKIGFRCVQAVTISDPTYTEFTSQETTNFSAATLSSVPNLTLAIDDKGKIAFPSDHNINAEGEDYDTNVKIENAMIYVNSAALDSTFNNSATLTFYNVDCNKPYVFYSETASTFAAILNENQRCLAPLCTNIQCTDSTLTVDVEHFTGFAAGTDANLTIEAEAGVFYPLDPIDFYAWYINSTDGTPISGECNISFDDNWTAEYPMDYNGSQYNYTKSSGFTAAGTHEYNVTCSSASFVTLEANDTKLVSSVDIPEFSVLTLGLGLVAVLAGLLIIRKKGDMK